MNYYNEFDRQAAAWLRELIRAGLIPAGDVDERDIREVRAHELQKYTQCHFFAGIGGWSYALGLAGWPEDRPVWTGSCPCQPFSAAGKRKGAADSRHLWPEFKRLIAECGPATVFGEQVASADGRKWLSGVRADLEGMAYRVGAADLCAAGKGAPHIRQRLYWVADAGYERAGRTSRPSETESGRSLSNVAGCCNVGGLAVSNGGQSSDRDLQRSGEHGFIAEDGGVGGVGDTMHAERGPISGPVENEQHGCDAGRAETLGQPGASGEVCGLGETHDAGPQGRSGRSFYVDGAAGRQSAERQPCETGFWDAYDLLPCTDGKARRVEPGTFPLAHGVPARVGRLRGYGNAIVPQLAAEFIQAYQETGHTE